MVYLKLILDERKFKQNDIYSIVVRIVYNRKVTTLTTGVRIERKYWDYASGQIINTHPNYMLLNTKLSEFYLKVQKAVLSLENIGSFSIEELRQELSNNKPTNKITSSTTFNEFSQKLIQDLIAINKSGNAIIYRTASNRLIAYADNQKLKFRDIDYNLLEGFKNTLLQDGVKPNSVHNYFRTIRAIYNKAIKAKLIDRSYYPFHDVKVKLERTAKRAVPVDCIKKLYKLELKPDSRQWHARNYFILSFSLIGMSFTDMAYLIPKSIVRGRLIYNRRKTHKTYDIKLTTVAIQILKLYEGRNTKYLLPILPPSVVEDSMEAKKIISQWIKTTNKWLRKLAESHKLEEDLTTYVTRHSWATSAKRLGYSIELIAEAMGHEHGNRITNIYLDTFDQEVIDEVNERVVNTIV
ncbi:tyrosine-type recombinase/integrase (plasmid) [Pedobacter sp. BS3]|uniref:site-specific integrase n=1 Tax=Pedobacter sp. BS3 TaxID=2567937 RepID=UPI0011EE58E3|nr:site-specific integrase [Pedobacter sp. BS3]TZF85806.1 tyrosine-type recombinase/integrase [Pedobacter sp. BS3]